MPDREVVLQRPQADSRATRTAIARPSGCERTSRSPGESPHPDDMRSSAPAPRSCPRVFGGRASVPRASHRRLQSGWGREAALRPFAPDAMRDAAVIAWRVRLLRSGTSPDGARDLLALYRDIDVRDVLPAIRVPTLVLHRGGDLISTAAQGRYIAARIPDARYVELPGSDHIPVLGDVDPLLDEIGRASCRERV